MTTVDGINSNGLYNISPAITNGNNRYAVSYTGGLQNDVYEGSNNKKTKELWPKTKKWIKGKKRKELNY